MRRREKKKKKKRVVIIDLLAVQIEGIIKKKIIKKDQIVEQALTKAHPLWISTSKWTTNTIGGTSPLEKGTARVVLFSTSENVDDQSRLVGITS